MWGMRVVICRSGWEAQTGKGLALNVEPLPQLILLLAVSYSHQAALGCPSWLGRHLMLSTSVRRTRVSRHSQHDIRSTAFTARLQG